jgi:hypothetical protein
MHRLVTYCFCEANEFRLLGNKFSRHLDSFESKPDLLAPPHEGTTFGVLPGSDLGVLRNQASVMGLILYGDHSHSRTPNPTRT